VAERPFGPYRLVRQVAVGGMAEIHLAKTRGIGGFEKYVALKMIHPNFAEDESFIQMLIDEAKISVQLQHANIAHTFDLGRVGGTYYITMEFVDGVDLYKLLRQASEIDAEFPIPLAAHVAKEMSLGLDYAHRKRDVAGNPLGIVHRDVSPQNVLIAHNGEVKLVDFGIAKASMKARQTAVGVIKGKYYYMSPEQAWGDVVDCRSDVFSTGIVLYEMLTGQMLYLEEDLHRLLDMVRRADIARPSTLRRGIPAQLEQIVMRALAPRVDDRYPSSQALASDLERFLHAHAPTFSSNDVIAFSRHVLGEPVPVDAAAALPKGSHQLVTQQVQPDELMREPDELRDANSVIFRLSDLRPSSHGEEGLSFSEPTEAAAPRGLSARAPTAASASPPPRAPGLAPPPSPAPPARPGSPTGAPIPRITAMAGARGAPTAPPPAGPAGVAGPTVPRPAAAPRPATLANVVPRPAPAPPPAAAAPAPRRPMPSSRRFDEHTREIDTGAVARHAAAALEAMDPADMTHAGPPPNFRGDTGTIVSGEAQAFDEPTTSNLLPRGARGPDAEPPADERAETTADLGSADLDADDLTAAAPLHDHDDGDGDEHTVITQSPKFIEARTIADAGPRPDFDHDGATQALGRAIRAAPGPGGPASSPALAARNPRLRSASCGARGPRGARRPRGRRRSAAHRP
jgi:serine/threonine protein kinase